MEKDSRSPWRAIGLVGTIGVELATSVIFGFWVGRWLDGKFGTEPWLMLAGVLLGLAVGIYGIVLLVKTYFGE